MDRNFQRTIAACLGSIRASHEELQKPAFWNYERIVVRKNLISLIEQCTALLAELNENELKEQKELQSERQAAIREMKEQAEAQRQLDPTAETHTPFVDPTDNPLPTILLLIVLPIVLILLICLVYGNTH
jgi:hypothetical protein